MKYLFIEPGTQVIDVKEGCLYLDVGNDLNDNIIDHHQPNAPKHCATYLLSKNSHVLKSNINTIVLHTFVDLDCIASSYLASYYLINKNFPSFYEELIQYVDKIDFGLPSKNKVSLYSLFSFLKKDFKSDEETLKMGHKLIEELSLCGFDSGEIPDKYHEISQEIEDDHSLYLNDLKSSQIIKTKLPFKNKEGCKLCSGLVLFNPQSILFKDWARNDSLHSKCEFGFDFLIVKWNEKRVVISVKPDDEIYLKGLGDILNELEKRQRIFLNIEIQEDNRVGYNMPDPWYDGRNAYHNYTIIDTPRMGTVLEFEDILNIVQSKINNSSN